MLESVSIETQKYNNIIQIISQLQAHIMDETKKFFVYSFYISHLVLRKIKWELILVVLIDDYNWFNVMVGLQ